MLRKLWRIASDFLDALEDRIARCFTPLVALCLLFLFFVFGILSVPQESLGHLIAGDGELSRSEYFYFKRGYGNRVLWKIASIRSEHYLVDEFLVADYVLFLLRRSIHKTGMVPEGEMSLAEIMDRFRTQEEKENDPDGMGWLSSYLKGKPFNRDELRTYFQSFAYREVRSGNETPLGINGRIGTMTYSVRRSQYLKDHFYVKRNIPSPQGIRIMRFNAFLLSFTRPGVYFAEDSPDSPYSGGNSLLFYAKTKKSDGDETTFFAVPKVPAAGDYPVFEENFMPKTYYADTVKRMMFFLLFFLFCLRFLKRIWNGKRKPYIFSVVQLVSVIIQGVAYGLTLMVALFFFLQSFQELIPDLIVPVKEPDARKVAKDWLRQSKIEGKLGRVFLRKGGPVGDSGYYFFEILDSDHKFLLVPADARFAPDAIFLGEKGEEYLALYLTPRGSTRHVRFRFQADNSMKINSVMGKLMKKKTQGELEWERALSGNRNN